VSLRACARACRAQAAESLFLKAKRPEAALKMYKDARMWHDALRLAEDWNLPNKVAEIQAEIAGGACAWCVCVHERARVCVCMCACVRLRGSV